MERVHLHNVIRDARLSGFEKSSLVTGFMLIAVATCFAVFHGDLGGAARFLGSCGLVALVSCPVARSARSYREAVAASLPTSVARVDVRIRPRRLFSATAFALTLGLPLAAGVLVVAAFEAGWLVLAGVLLLGCACAFWAWWEDARWPAEAGGRTLDGATAEELLKRLCMRAGMRAPELVVSSSPFPVAWTAGGRIHVTRPLLELLEDGELEAVIAHELAHLAHRDAVVMEICAAPSRVLLAAAGTLAQWLGRALRSIEMWLNGGWLTFGLAVAAGVCAPPAFVVGWISRFSALGISRAREYSADAAAATLTGRPSALASALLKLDRESGWTPRRDLRQTEAPSVLCIVGTTRAGLGRLLSTHPSTARRVRRLEQLEARIQGRSYAAPAPA